MQVQDIKHFLAASDLVGKKIEKITQRSYLMAFHVEGGQEVAVFRLDELASLGHSDLDSSDIAVLQLQLQKEEKNNYAIRNQKIIEAGT